MRSAPNRLGDDVQQWRQRTDKAERVEGRDNLNRDSNPAPIEVHRKADPRACGD
jgi:hypothetical protein